MREERGHKHRKKEQVTEGPVNQDGQDCKTKEKVEEGWEGEK